jgi:tRNA G46 methylase TrmB
VVVTMMPCRRRLEPNREKLRNESASRKRGQSQVECAKKMANHRRYAPATVRNRDFILDVLRDVLPMTGVILEIASGSGEHVVHFARNLPNLAFQPSDPEPEALLSVAA